MCNATHVITSEAQMILYGNTRAAFDDETASAKVMQLGNKAIAFA
jgi:hypothetical protein